MHDFNSLLRDLIDEVARYEAVSEQRTQKEAEIVSLKAAALSELEARQGSTEFQVFAKTMLAMQGAPGSTLKVAVSYLSLDDYLDPANKQPLATITHNIRGLYGNLSINLVSQPQSGRRDALSSRHLSASRLQIVIGNSDAPKDFFPAEFELGSVPIKAILRNMFSWAEEEGLIDRKAAFGVKPCPAVEGTGARLQ